MCECDLNNLNPADLNRDIFVSNVSLEAFGRYTGQALEADIITYQTDNRFNWGPVHHAKVLYSRNSRYSATKVLFLRFCDTSCHDQVIAELNGVEWPVGYGRTLYMEFNRNYTQPHQILARERYFHRNAATQTESIITATTSTITSKTFGGTFVPSSSDFCFWQPEDFKNDKYSIYTEDDAAKQGGKEQKSKVKNKGSVRTIMAKFLINQRRAK